MGHPAAFLAGIVAAGPVSVPGTGRQHPGKPELQIRIGIAGQGALGPVSWVPEDALNGGISQLKIPIRQWRLLRRSQRRIGEVRVQVLPGTVCRLNCMEGQWRDNENYVCSSLTRVAR